MFCYLSMFQVDLFQDAEVGWNADRYPYSANVKECKLQNQVKHSQ